MTKQKPPKVKKPMSEKRIEQFKKVQEKRMQNIEAKKKEKKLEAYKALLAGELDMQQIAATKRQQPTTQQND